MSQKGYENPAAKEVVSCRTALWKGYGLVNENQIWATNIDKSIERYYKEPRHPLTLVCEQAGGG